VNNNQQKPPREIERKFRVKQLPPGLEKFPREKIAQGYLVVGKGSHVRLRKRGDVVRSPINEVPRERAKSAKWLSRQTSLKRSGRPQKDGD
jgi:hypothetical protein